MDSGLSTFCPPRLMFPMKIDHRPQNEDRPHNGNSIPPRYEKVKPAYFCIAKLLKEHHTQAPQVSKGIGYVHDKSHGARILEGSGKTVKENTVEGNIAQVQTQPDQDHAGGRADQVGLKKVTCQGDQDHPQHDNDMVDQESQLVVFYQHEAAHDDQYHNGYGYFCGSKNFR